MTTGPLLASVLVPYRPDGAWRDSAWNAIRPRWEALGVELIVESPGPGESPAEFNHPLAINRAAAKAGNDVLIVSDADTGWTPGLPERMVAAVRGGAPWALPLDYAKLTRPQTERLYRYRNEPDLHDLVKADWVGRAVSWAGLICFTYDAWSEVGGYDERYTHWGADDMANGLTMNELVGPVERVPGAAIHYWHPTPLDHNYGHPKHQEQYDLGERYKAAVGDPEAMRRVRFDAS